MKSVSRLFFQSVMNYINLSLFIIVTIAMMSIFFSFWISEKADNDAKAINLSGTMRMQMYQIGLSLFSSPEQTDRMIRTLDQTWDDSLFSTLRAELESEELNQKFQVAHTSWKTDVKPALLTATNDQIPPPSLFEIIDRQVMLTDDLVDEFQTVAEKKIRELRTIQFFALIFTTLIGSLIFYLLRSRIEMPLKALTQAAKEISQGKFEEVIPEHGHDELSDLARAFNQMSASIRKTWSELESLVDKRTLELSRKNTIVTFLYNTAKATVNTEDHQLDLNKLTQELSDILEDCEIEICLFTAEGTTPYQRIGSGKCVKTCEEANCGDCLSDTANTTQSLSLDHHYQIEYQEKQYGVITAQRASASSLTDWQDRLLKSCSDQLAIAFSLSENMNQEHRLAMLRERTVIARELHDSLAQSLSYLQIQVTRLQKAQDKGRTDLQEPIMTELREGLSSAYRHLRELLTTFRLKVDEDGLEGALKLVQSQLASQTEMTVDLSYQLKGIPLSANEEIHLLQIVREACQNAINHSQGKKLNIRLQQLDDQSIELRVEDDGKGLPQNPEKLNHYGLAIMQERSKHLGGEITIGNSEAGGVEVVMRFTPQYAKEAA